MIPIFPESKIYILCPPNHATGGPEALHQLACHLKKIGFHNVFMYYVLHDKSDTQNPVHPFYVKYDTIRATEIEDDENNLVITPETILKPLFNSKLKRIRKAIWWLSVTNYYIILNPRIRQARRDPIYWVRKIFNPKRLGTLKELQAINCYHIAHSFFSNVHLRDNGIIPNGRISDYMNQAFFEKVDESTPKQDTVIYNPVKNGAFLNEIIERTPNLNWQPLVNMTPAEVASMMNKSKLYIDFGYHPGKERMPREACIMRCCMIIGKDGSAKYKEDMPIPDQYRFEKESSQIDAIVSKINDCLINYEERIADFVTYRNTLFREESDFVRDVKSVFQLVGPSEK